MISHLDDIMDNTRYSEPNWEQKYKDLKTEFDKIKAKLDAFSKVTTATEPSFKVGDRVLVKGYHCIASIAAIGTQTAQIRFREKFSPSINVPLTDLTLITE
jgi:hypothetical protein